MTGSTRRVTVALACLAITLPTLIAFNVPPSATFFNQAAAFVGWGGFLLVLGASMRRDAWPRSSGALALLAAMAIVFACAIAASPIESVPWSLSLSNGGTILAAILAIAVGAAVARAGLGEGAFRACCLALVVAGVASSAIGLVQVFAPGWPDGEWFAVSAIPGRATGNLRQPNHLSSLLLWSIVAVVWLGEAKALPRAAAALLAVVFMYVVVLSASRTGAVGMLTLAGWGLLDRRLSKQARTLLVVAPILYGAMWWGTTVWATHSHQLFGGQTRFGGGGDISSSRFAIWRDTLSLIAMHPWLGVGFGDFNFAWSLTPFPQRPVAFFDHTHNIVLNFAVELGLPLAIVVLALMLFAMWRALQNALADGRQPAAGERVPLQRAAFVIVVMVAVHSLLEYPLWYSYFLLPTAFCFGLCLERPAVAAPLPLTADERHSTRPFVLAAMLLVMGSVLALYDYFRVVVIFAPPSNAGPLEQRIVDGRRSVFFGHHADYAAATIAEHPGRVMAAFDRAPHYLLDSRLMQAWAIALAEKGEAEKARYVAARLKEFRNDSSAEFFAPCASATRATAAAALASEAAARGSALALQAAGAPSTVAGDAPSPPFQCMPPTVSLRYEDFKRSSARLGRVE